MINLSGEKMTKLFNVLLGLTILIFIFVAVTDNAFSQGMIQKIGKRCPFGYTPDGSYCRPLVGAKEVIAKIGRRCPFGFTSDGDYCRRIQSKPTQVIQKVGKRCPKGFTSDGDYCRSLN